MAIQTTYKENIDAARVGMIADEEPSVLISRNVETTAGVAFGVPVTQGTADNGADIVGAGSTEVVGITVRERSANPVTPDSFAAGESARLMRKGVLWVGVADAGGVVAGDPVWVTLADATFANADAGADGSILLNGARWENTAADGALAKIRFDLDAGVTLGAS